MDQQYTSTDCRVGNHLRCWQLRIVPHCACECHEGPPPEGYDPDEAPQARLQLLRKKADPEPE